MTNWEYLEALANNSPDELQAWFDSEHVETPNATLHGDTAALDAKCNMLYDELDAAYAKNRSLREHIAKMQEGRNGWHIKGKELQKKVDSLTAELDSARRDRETYRELLGKAIDFAYAITLLVDEGAA